MTDKDRLQSERVAGRQKCCSGFFTVNIVKHHNDMEISTSVSKLQYVRMSNNAHLFITFIANEMSQILGAFILDS